MPILYRYVTREILRYFFLIQVLVVTIYLAVDFFEKIDNFMEAGLPLSRALTFFVLKTPFIVDQITPVGFLLSVLVVFGLMGRKNEIIALKSGGVSGQKLLRPVIFIGLVFTLLFFVLAEGVVPVTTAAANRIWLREVKKEASLASREKNIWLKGDRSISHITYFVPKEGAVFGVTVNDFDADFRLTRRIDAKKGVYTGGKWVLSKVVEQKRGPLGDYSVAYHENLTPDLEFKPENLSRLMKKSHEMGFIELYDYVRKVQAEGYDATIYRVDLYGKTAFRLACLIMGVAGTGIALRGKTREGLPVVIAYGIGTAFLYWIFHSFCVSLGYAEMLPPFVAAFSADFVFICFGIFMLLGTE